MKPRSILPLLLAPATLNAAAQPSPPAEPRRTDAERPNILLIVVDDLGYSDLQAYGNTRIRTPHIDGLGQHGVRFTHAYCSSPISGPSRAGIFTGRCQNRFGYEFMPYDRFDDTFMKEYKKYFIPYYLKKKPEGLKDFSPNLFVRRGKHQTDLPSDEITLAQLLRPAGYATGLVGKWNVGSSAASTPDEYGYGYSYYFSGALTRYVDDPVDTTQYVEAHCPWAFSDIPAWQRRSGPTAIREGNRVVADTGYLTFSFADKAVRFIERNSDRPFFLTLTFNAPHDPFQAPRTYYDRIDEADPVKRVYYAMIEALDDAVGRVVETLRQNGLFDNTLIVFTSDNGGASYTRATDNLPFSGGKCTLFDGGLRVPFYVKFPAREKLQGVVYDQPVSSLDIFSTLLAAAKVAPPADREYDSQNLLPYLNGTHSEGPHSELFWRNGYLKACIAEGWKLYLDDKDRRVMLFDLQQDPSENFNLADRHPERVDRMRRLIEQWEQQVVPPLWPSSGNFSIQVNGTTYRFPV